jgi:hypothetical protein
MTEYSDNPGTEHDLHESRARRYQAAEQRDGLLDISRDAYRTYEVLCTLLL